MAKTAQELMDFIQENDIKMSKFSCSFCHLPIFCSRHACHPFEKFAKD